MLEGFYGNPWTHEQRLELLGFMASRGMNTYVYAPKDDPRMRRDWRAAYEGVDLRRLNELVNRSQAAGVDLMFCVSPGLTMRYSDEEDVDALCDKLAAIAELGVGSFGLLFDDIPPDFQHDADREAFDTLADAHVARRQPGLRAPRARDAAHGVPDRRTAGIGTEPYLAILGAGLEPGIDVFWTGRADVLADPRRPRRGDLRADRPPARDLLGQLPGQRRLDELRAPHRARTAGATRTCSATRSASSRTAWSCTRRRRSRSRRSRTTCMAPEAYDAEKSWRRAIRDVAGDADLEAFALFADNVRSSAISPDDAPAVTRALQAFAFRTDQGDGAAAASDLGTLAERLVAAARPPAPRPRREPGAHRRVPALDRGVRGRGAWRCATSRPSPLERRLEQDGPAELRPYLVRLRQARVRVFGDVLDMALADLTHTNVRPGELTRDAAQAEERPDRRSVNSVSRWRHRGPVASERTVDTVDP